MFRYTNSLQSKLTTGRISQEKPTALKMPPQQNLLIQLLDQQLISY